MQPAEIILQTDLTFYSFLWPFVYFNFFSHSLKATFLASGKTSWNGCWKWIRRRGGWWNSGWTDGVKRGEVDELDDGIVGRENKNSLRRKQHSYTKTGSESQSYESSVSSPSHRLCVGKQVCCWHTGNGLVAWQQNYTGSNLCGTTENTVMTECDCRMDGGGVGGVRNEDVYERIFLKCRRTCNMVEKF